MSLSANRTHFAGTCARLLKTLSRAIVEAKLQRVERELMLRGISYSPSPRSPRG
jgi:hypothetical protein